MAKAYKNLMDAVKQVQKEARSELSLEEHFLKEFDTTLIQMEKERQQPVPREYIRPSSMYGCPRMLYAMRMGIPAEPDDNPGLIGICESGTDRHTRIQNVVSMMPNVTCIDVEAQVEQARLRGVNTEFVGWNRDHTEARCKNNDYGIYFQPDGVIRYRDIKAVLEIKTESVYQWMTRVDAKEFHKIQATCYAEGLGLDWVLFLYEDRNFTRKKSYLWRVEQATKDLIRAKVDLVSASVEAQTPPPKDEEKCSFCRYKKWCKEVG